VRALGAVLTAAVLGGCGHIGFDERTGDDGGDAPTQCPADMVLIDSGADVCVEKAERGYAPWLEAKTACVDLGRRLCDGTEWYIACLGAPFLVDMANDGGGANPQWEWFAGLSVDIAEKGGFAECADTSSHVVTDPYDFRCCLTLAAGP
jgi:hypothetical protein